MKWLVLGEVIVVIFLLILKFIYDKIKEHKDTKNIDKVLEYIDKKSKENEDVTDKFKECLDIIKKNSKEN